MAALVAGKSGEWLEVTREVTGSQFYCSYTESGCPCCTCDESSAVRVVYTRMRWSKSGKRHVAQSHVVFLCAAHMSEEIL